MRRLKICLDRKSLQVIYFTFIRPIIEYGDVVWENIPQYLKNDLDKIQNEAARIVTGCSKLASLDELKKNVVGSHLAIAGVNTNLYCSLKLLNALYLPVLVILSLI